MFLDSPEVRDRVKQWLSRWPRLRACARFLWWRVIVVGRRSVQKGSGLKRVSARRTLPDWGSMSCASCAGRGHGLDPLAQALGGGADLRLAGALPAA